MSLTGPYVKLDVSSGSSPSVRLAYHRKQWYRSHPVRSEPTPFVSQHAVSHSTDESLTYYSPLDAPNYQWSYDIWEPEGSSISQVKQARATAINKAYSKFRESIYDRVELGLNIAERRQTINMMASRANTLRRAYEALKRGNVGAMKDALGITTGGGGRWARPDQASRLWLEYHFGWEQLLKDIHDAAVYLDAPWPKNLKASGKGTGSTSVNIDTTQPWGYGWKHTYNLRWHVAMGATVSVTNPSLYTLTTLGLINPASIAWEVVPFSFVVDWFLPIGNYLASYTDFVGISVSKPYTTEYRVASNGQSQYWPNSYNPATPIRGESWVMSRSLGIVGPVLRLKQYKGISPVRAATAISLLIQSFRSRLPT